MSNANNGIVAELKDLRVHFDMEGDPVRAVDGIDLTIGQGETVALVGESGCGKSVTSLALARLVPEPPGIYAGGQILYEQRDVLRMKREELRDLRGHKISYIFQDPSASLNPVFRVGYQIAEALRLHRKDVGIREEVVNLLRMVGIADPEERADAYPHEMSGGMQQRAMMAMALACRPKLLVADEPTTALDVTIQAQILDLLMSLQYQLGMAILLITHNLGLVAGVAHRVYVMYAGRMVESGPTEEVLAHPRHPYTKGLLEAVPRLQGNEERLQGIEGVVPNPARMPSGCRFHPRCPMRQAMCEEREPDLQKVADNHDSRCHFWRDLVTK